MTHPSTEEGVAKAARPFWSDRVQQAVEAIMAIEDQLTLEDGDLSKEDLAILARGRGRVVTAYVGILSMDSLAAYDQLDRAFKPYNLVALFRWHGATSDRKHKIIIARGRARKPKPLPTWPAAVLFVLTILSVLYTGLIVTTGEISLTDPASTDAIMAQPILNLWRGIPYAVAILAILVPHEMGHWLTTRRYGIPASLPYFIPAFILSPFGTFGAAIILRGTLRNRRVLFDLGASGPLAGLVFAVPILLIGLMTSPIIPLEPGGFLEGNSLLYAGAKILALGRFLPDGKFDVMLNSLAWAGWTGLFVTALNLIPLGQLDGGHVLYSLIGQRARILFWPILLVMIVLALFVSAAWVAFAIMLFLVGRYYAVPLDDITPLDPFRRTLAIVTLVIFVLVFIPNPIYGLDEPSGLLGLVLMSGALLATLQSRTPFLHQNP
ncbi:MAG: hypothetical protein CL607_26980 [Anaerolineaceae bacterium]|nr:hypothetical protein [Anaerolineaceae bacterium]